MKHRVADSAARHRVKPTDRWGENETERKSKRKREKRARTRRALNEVRESTWDRTGKKETRVTARRWRQDKCMFFMSHHVRNATAGYSAFGERINPRKVSIRASLRHLTLRIYYAYFLRSIIGHRSLSVTLPFSSSWRKTRRHVPTLEICSSVASYEIPSSTFSS